VIALLHSNLYSDENAEVLRQDWPRVPLPAGAAALQASAALGRQVAGLLDTETAVPRVTTGSIRPEIKVIGAVARTDGGQLNPSAGELDVTARWGVAGKGGVCMPNTGRLNERAYTPEERAALASGASALGLDEAAALACLGERTFDVYLNDVALWRNVPAKVWAYTLAVIWLVSNIPALRQTPYTRACRSTTALRARRPTFIPLGMSAFRRARLKVKIDFDTGTLSVWTPGPWHRGASQFLRRLPGRFTTLPPDRLCAEW
jgi:hypothetical protein